MGSIHRKTLAGGVLVLGIGIALTQYQNCAPTSNGGSLNVGTTQSSSTIGNINTFPSPSPGSSPTATPSPNVLIKYLCPLRASSGCSAPGKCQSTCLGQYSNSSSCIFYTTANITPNFLTCTPVSLINAIYQCNVVPSINCMDGSLCESTCLGQYQSAAFCTSHSNSGTPTNVNCTSVVGAGPVPLYVCPVIQSTNCSIESNCESTCVGGVSHLATCTYYVNGVGTAANCTSLGSASF